MNINPAKKQQTASQDIKAVIRQTRQKVVLYMCAAMSGLMFLSAIGISQEAPGTGSATLHVKDGGINMPWTSQMKIGDVFYPGQLKGNDLKDVRSQILVPMPSDDDMNLSVEELSDRMSAQLIQAVRARQKVGISEYEIQLIENINSPGYVDFVHRQSLVTKFGTAAYRAIGRVAEYLEAQHKTVKIDMTMGSNGTAVFARNVDAWKPFRDRISHVDLDDGRALWWDAVRAISTLGESKVRIINTKSDLGHSDWWAPPWSIGNYDVSRRIKESMPGVTSLLVRPKDGGDAHISFISQTDKQFYIAETVNRFIPCDPQHTGSRSGIFVYNVPNPVGVFTPKTLPQDIAIVGHPLPSTSDAPKMLIAPRQTNDVAAEKSTDLGGIDLTSLRLSYVRASTPNAVDTVYSMPKGNASDLVELAGNHDLPGKAFRIAASMPESIFWVNLNPKEPNRIADSRLGKTDVARVLLEADLQLKRDAAAITDPRTSPVGHEYWARIEAAADSRANGSEIVQGSRVWIVPGKIVIAGDDKHAYVEQARMEVKLESQYLETQSDSGTMSGDHEDILAATDAIARDLVLPILNDWVNRAPQYEELRQVFASLVLAQWYKDHHGTLDRQDPAAKEWLSDPSWTPRATWLDYMYSLKNGEYNFSEVTTSSKGNLIVTETVQYFNGGVDFTRISLPHPRPLSEDELKTMNTALAASHSVLWQDRLWFANTDLLGSTPQRVGAAGHSGTHGTVRVAVLIIVLLLIVVLSPIASNKIFSLSDQTASRQYAKAAEGKSIQGDSGRTGA